MNNIIEENKNMIYAISNYFKNYSNKDDLFQVGCIGLLKAYNKFNPQVGVKFSTYAYTYIIGEMKKLVREDKNIKISREITMLNHKIEQVKAALEQQWSRCPTTKEIADFMDIDEYLVSEALLSVNCVDSMDYTINDDGKELTLYDLVGSNMDVDTILELKEQLDKLDPLEQQIILLRYQNDLTQAETAKKLGINQVQVSRKESKVLIKLKKELTI